jgi:hypothetical protein
MIRATLVLLSASALAAPASAALLVDGFAPLGTAPFETNWTNFSLGQNFLTRFTLSQAASITSVSILMGRPFAVVGETARLKIREDDAGNPAATNLVSLVLPITSVSDYEFGVDLVTVDVAPIALAAGTYWFGLSGESEDLVWASYNIGDILQPSYQRQLFQDTVVATPFIYTLSYRIEGTTGDTPVIPEPATWALMIAGFGLVGTAARRRTRAARA